MPDRAIITYIRVSTTKQGRAGLGVEAQRTALGHFARAEGFEVVREFVEVETGKGADALDRRPQLKAALAAARKHRCHVAVPSWTASAGTFISSAVSWPTRCPS